MEQRRFILFLTLSMAVLIGWMNVGPMLFPDWFPKPIPKQAADAKANAAKQDGKQAAKQDGKAADKQQQKADKTAADKTAADKTAADKTVAAAAGDSKTDAEPNAVGKKDEGDVKQPPPGADRAEDDGKSRLPKFPTTTIVLGSSHRDSEYFESVELTSIGAAVAAVELNDDRYKVLRDPNPNKPQLSVVGNNVESFAKLRPLQKFMPPITLQMSLKEFDDQLQKLHPNADLNRVNWEVVEQVADPDDARLLVGVTFALTSPDGKLRVLKTYKLHKVEKAASAEAAERNRDTYSLGYQLSFGLTIRNIDTKPLSVAYGLQGPVGLPLENANNTRKFREVKVGLRDEDGKVEAESVTAADILKADADNEIEGFKPNPRTFQYVGIDVQYFAALLLPDDHGKDNKQAFLEIAKPQLIEKAKTASHSDISLALTSSTIELLAGESVTHSYSLFAGPKRNDLLQPLCASAILDFGWFGFVSKGMLSVLTFLHSWGIAYGIAIVMLTVMVRGCMYPISRKQAAGAKKMKELQPKIAELRKKYENEKEKMAKAQMELFSKNNYNPLAGCLPMFLQLPIFIGLYQALNNAVDLRMAKFLWIDNLAAPDAMFQLPFVVPFVGWTEFNLLPLVTIVLFIAQQKMFMPPPTDDQSAMQQKMMNYMMIFMGFLFYTMPAGLCVYFIASSLWGMAERKMLDYGSGKDPVPPKDTDSDPGSSSGPDKKKDNFWSRMGERIEAATEMQQQAESKPAREKSGSSKSTKKNKKNSRQRR